jgi:hypothetical protein
MYLDACDDQLDGIGSKLKKAVKKVRKAVKKTASVTTFGVTNKLLSSGTKKAALSASAIGVINRKLFARKQRTRVVPANWHDRVNGPDNPHGTQPAAVSAPYLSIPTHDYDEQIMTQEEREPLIIDASPRNEVEASGYYPGPEQRNEPDVPEMIEPGDTSDAENPPKKKVNPLLIGGGLLMLLNFL